MTCPYILLSTQSLERIRAHLKTCITEWSRAYLHRSDAFCDVRSQVISTDTVNRWQAASDDGESLPVMRHQLQCLLGQAQAQTLWTYISGTVPNPDALLSSDQRYIVSRTLHILLNNLSSGTADSSETVADFSLAHKSGSGWSAYKVILDELTLEIAVPPSVSLSWIGKSTGSMTQNKTPLVSAKLAIRPCELMLSAELGKVSLRLEDLRHLAVGDVLTLDRKLTDSLRLNTRSGSYVSDARLGCLDGSKALVLTGIK